MFGGPVDNSQRQLHQTSEKKKNNNNNNKKRRKIKTRTRKIIRTITKRRE